MDWITVTVLMCELQVSVTSCSGHTDLNENQTTPLPWESAAEVIVTLVTLEGTTSTQKPFHIWVITGCFPPIRLCANNNHSTHTLHPTLGHAFTLCRKDRYQIYIASVILANPKHFP